MEQSLEKIDIHASCFASHRVHSCRSTQCSSFVPKNTFYITYNLKGKNKSAEIRFGKEQHWKCLTLCIKHGNCSVLLVSGFRWISFSSWAGDCPWSCGGPGTPSWWAKGRSCSSRCWARSPRSCMKPSESTDWDSAASWTSSDGRRHSPGLPSLPQSCRSHASGSAYRSRPTAGPSPPSGRARAAAGPAAATRPGCGWSCCSGSRPARPAPRRPAARPRCS